MKITHLLCLILVLGTAQIIAQSDTLNLKEYDVKVVGTSTLHDWTVQVTDVEGFLIKEADAETSTHIKFSSNTMVSGRGATMDGKIKKALQSTAHPYITFKSKGIAKSANSLSVKGDLVIGGVSRSVDLDVKKNGTNSYETSEKITFSQFDIEPPSAMFGTITCGQDLDIIITLKFE